MKKKICLVIVILLIGTIFNAQDIIKLSLVQKDFALAKLLEGRESIRQFASSPLSIQEISSILWAGQGMKENSKKRTTPSAGALYPIELYVLVGNVSDLKSGIYHYEISSHSLKLLVAGDKRKELLEKKALRQEWVSTAPAIILITYVKARTANKYGERSDKYIGIEAGAVMQNIYLMAQSLTLGSCAVGAFDDATVKAIYNLKEEEPILLMPIGKIKE